MKKVIATFVILFLVGNYTFASDWYWGAGAMFGIGIGGFAIGAAESSTYEENKKKENYNPANNPEPSSTPYVIGGLSCVAGLVFLVLGLLDDASVAGLENKEGPRLVKDNPILEHGVLQIMSDRVYVGASFKF